MKVNDLRRYIHVYIHIYIHFYIPRSIRDNTRNPVSECIDKIQSKGILDLRLGNNDIVHVPVHVAVADAGGQELCVCIVYAAFMCVRKVCVWVLVLRTPEIQAEGNR